MAPSGDSYDKESPVIKLIILYIYFLFHVKIVFPVLTNIYFQIQYKLRNSSSIFQYIAAVIKSLGIKIQNIFQISKVTFKSVDVKIKNVNNLVKVVFESVGCRIKCMIKSFLCSCKCFFSSVSSVLKSKSVKKSLSPLRTGNYCANGVWYNNKLIVEGHKATVKDALGVSNDTKIEVGNLGKADPEIVEATGQDFYNMKLTIVNSQMDSVYGVVSQDGAKITMKGAGGIFVLNWITQEAADALDTDGDPVEAPHCPYKIQPDNPGKLLWLTGPGGTGKSTSAQLLGKNSGYVYYEGDCFSKCKNPYMPVDALEPGMTQYQRNLIGEGVDARRKAHQKARKCFDKFMLEGDYDIEDYKEFYGMMCEDIKKERKRIGGDWVITLVAMTKEIRDFFRSCLGPELVFVVLNMEEEELKKRVLRRHREDSTLTEDMFKLIMDINKLFEPVGDDEENALEVMVTNDMTKEDVANKILQTVEQFKKMD